MRRGNCENCVHWDRMTDNPSDANFYSKGLCFRWAPRPKIVPIDDDVDYYVQWPVTYASTFCGEFAAINVVDAEIVDVSLPSYVFPSEMLASEFVEATGEYGPGCVVRLINGVKNIGRDWHTLTCGDLRSLLRAGDLKHVQNLGNKTLVWANKVFEVKR